MIERQAMDLGILENPEFFLSTEYVESVGKFARIPDHVLKALIKMGKEIGSYMDALIYFNNHDYINDDELTLLKKTVFISFLTEEMINKRMLKKENCLF